MCTRLDREIYNRFENGRVIGLKDKAIPDYKMFDSNNNNNNKFKNEALKGIQVESPLSFYFFSKTNMQHIQDNIRYGVFKRSNGKHVIGKQSNVELEIIMRSIFLQHAKNLNCKMREQIAELNSMVVAWAVPRIIGEIEQYQSYIYDTSNMPIPIAHPVNLSSAGTKTLRSVTTTF